MVELMLVALRCKIQPAGKASNIAPISVTYARIDNVDTHLAVGSAIIPIALAFTSTLTNMPIRVSSPLDYDTYVTLTSNGLWMPISKLSELRKLKLSIFQEAVEYNIFTRNDLNAGWDYNPE